MKPSPFNVGDVVKYINKKDTFWKYGEEHIIHEVTINQRCWEYSTDHGAWFNPKDFELVRRADKESLAILVKSLEINY